MFVVFVMLSAGLLSAVVGQGNPAMAESSPILKHVDYSLKFEALNGAGHLVMFEDGNDTYAIVSAWGDNAIQIINVTDPFGPVPVSAIFDGSDGFEALGGAVDTTLFYSGNDTYAIVSAWDDYGVQIINITDPFGPVPVSAIFDNFEGSAVLPTVTDTEIFHNGNDTYALMTSLIYNAVQIINITDPFGPIPVSAIFDDSDGFEALNSPYDAEIFYVKNNTYAIVTAYDDDGIQVIDITDPFGPVPVSAVFDGSGGFAALDGARHAEVFNSGNHTYVIVTAMDESPIHTVTDPFGDRIIERILGQNGAIQIINVTDPFHPIPVSTAFDGHRFSFDADFDPEFHHVPVSGDSDGSRGFEALGGANRVAVFNSGNHTYVMVTSWYDNGIQVIDVTDPFHPIPVSAIFDGSGGFVALGVPNQIETYERGNRTYAMVTSWNDDGIQVIDITDPFGPVPVSAVLALKNLVDLNYVEDLETFNSGNRTYAMVASRDDDYIQIIDVTHTFRPVPVSAIFDGLGGFAALDGSKDVEIFTNGNRTYAVVVATDTAGIQIMEITDPTEPSSVLHTFGGFGGSAYKGINDVEVFRSENHTYAIMIDDGNEIIQITNITDTVNPVFVSTIPNDSLGSAEIRDSHTIKAYSVLDGDYEMEVFESQDSTYAIVIPKNKDGIRIINITNPANPTPILTIHDNSGGFDALRGVKDVEVFDSRNHTYAMAVAKDDNGIQIIDITNPANPVPASIFDDSAGLHLYGVRDVEVFVSGRHTYAIAAPMFGDAYEIINITNPSKPFPSYATSADSIRAPFNVEVFSNGIYTYAITAPYMGDAYQITNITNPSNPSPLLWESDIPETLIASLTMYPEQYPSDIGMPPDIFGDVKESGSPDETADMEVFSVNNNTYAIATTWNNGTIRILDVTNPSNPVHISAIFDDSGEFGDIDGVHKVAVFDIDNYTYAMVAPANDDAAYIVDVTNPSNPSIASVISDDSEEFDALGPANDMAIFNNGNQTYAAIAIAKHDRIHIVDVTRPSNPTHISTIFDGSGEFDVLGGVKYLDVFTSGGDTYIMSVATDDAGMQIINITNPANPVPASATFDGIGGLALNRINDIDIFGDETRAYAVTVTTDDALSIINLTDPIHPALVSIIYDGSEGFDTLGGPSHIEVFTSGGDTFVAVLAIRDGWLHVVDITDPVHPVSVFGTDSWKKFGDLNGIADMEVLVDEKYVYAMALLHDNSVVAYKIHDYVQPPSVPASPASETGYYDNMVHNLLREFVHLEVYGSGNDTHAIVTMYDGVSYIMNITDPSRPAPVSGIFDGSEGFDTLYNATAMGVFGNGDGLYAIVAIGDDLHVVDVTDPANPMSASIIFDGSEEFATLGGPASVEVFESGNGTYVMIGIHSNDDSIYMVDVTDPFNPIPVSLIPDGSNWFEALSNVFELEAFRSGNDSYVMVNSHDNDANIHVLDVTDPTRPIPVSVISDGLDEFTTSYNATAMEVFKRDNSTYAVTAAIGGIHVVDVTDPTHPMHISTLSDDSPSLRTLPHVTDMELFGSGNGTYAAMSSFTGMTRIMDISDPTNPTLASTIQSTNLFSFPFNVEVFESGNKTYVIITYLLAPVKIVDISDPTNPIHVPTTLDYTHAE